MNHISRWFKMNFIITCVLCIYHVTQISHSMHCMVTQLLSSVDSYTVSHKQILMQIAAEQRIISNISSLSNIYRITPHTGDVVHGWIVINELTQMCWCWDYLMRERSWLIISISVLFVVGLHWNFYWIPEITFDWHVGWPNELWIMIYEFYNPNIL